MAEYQIAYNNTTKVVTVQSNGDALPAGSNKIGTFKHDELADPLGNNPLIPGDGQLAESHVIWHHVRDALYHTRASDGVAVPGELLFPDNITDMGGITLNIDTDYVALTGIAITPTGTSTLTVASPTVQLAITKTPANASNGTVTYTSSNLAVATVSSTGLVTRVANGSAVITATSQDGAKTATKNITCTA